MPPPFVSAPFGGGHQVETFIPLPGLPPEFPVTAHMYPIPRWNRSERECLKAPQDEEIIAEAHPRYLAETIPGAELALLPNCGHFGLMQEPKAFNARMLAFLRE